MAVGGVEFATFELTADAEGKDTSRSSDHNIALKFRCTSGNSAWSAVGSSLDSWQGLSCAGLDSHDSGPSAGGNLGHNCDRELFLDA